LPVARAVWVPRPNLAVSAACWLYAGGAHHTGFSQALNLQHLEDFTEIAGLEHLVIGEDTTVSGFRKELRWNQAYFQ
jgi:L-arabinose isomerase